MRPIHTFTVTPSLPERLKACQRIAYNLRWAWNHDSIELFRREEELWNETNHNPVKMLGMADQKRLAVAAADEGFVAHMERVARDLDGYLNEGATWFRRHYGSQGDGLKVAYFSAEFGLTECLSIFAGGLGILAGDHLKASSDLGVPLIGVGLLYQQGYFRQYLNAAGWQQESYENNDFHNLPLTQTGVRVEVDFPDGRVQARVWRADVGRVALYLLDTNVPENTSATHRDITDQLYGGDNEIRLRQEILLGIGGYRALLALGIEPSVFHMNEGHSAFLALEHIRHLMQTRSLSFGEARSIASAGLIFTTHTPVPAGHDYFPPDMMGRYFGGYAAQLGLSWNDFMALGRQNPGDHGERFCMTVLALRLASFSNGVSRLHGEVSRKMWRKLWPGVPTREIPIGHVTNGVHFRSWVSAEMDELYDRYLGPRWSEDPSEASLWARAASIPSAELWRTHERRRERLVSFARRHLRRQLIGRGAPKPEIDQAEDILDPEALTIGFARRFATYKRATLILDNPERLARILNNPDRPVQIVFAGKAHPRDDHGKDFIRRIIEMARRPEFRRRMVFLEDYDMSVARSLLQGSDVWLNTPRRPLEASGTSGMKAVVNGGLNLSVLDGWWDEAWRDAESRNARVGWALGAGEEYENEQYQDQLEGRALLDLIEHEVVPIFYDRRADGVPRRWVEMMKDSLRVLAPQFNMHRLVRQYTGEYYLMAHRRCASLCADNSARARRVAAWLERLRGAWPQVRIEAIENGMADLAVNDRVPIRARVHLGPLTPDDVQVEIFVGKVDASGEMQKPIAFQMDSVGPPERNTWIFETPAAHAENSGLHGYTVRVLPYHVDLVAPFVPGMVAWPPSDVMLLSRVATESQ